MKARSAILTIVLASALCGTVSTGQDSFPLPELSPEQLALPFPATQDEIAACIAFLADDRMRGREGGSPEEAIAAAYIASEFRALGLAPAGDDGGYEQKFVLASAQVAGPDAGKPIYSRNVLGWLAGSDPKRADEYYLVGAHYDHLGVHPSGDVFNGADDNASGVAGLLAIAKACALSGEKEKGAGRPRRSVLFVAFGSEEKRLVGSRFLVKHPARPLERLAVMINLDMIGRPRFFDTPELAAAKTAAGIADGPGVGVLARREDRFLVALAKSACAHDTLPAYAPEDFPLLEKLIRNAAAGRDDSAPFRDRGIPALFFSTSENADYHKPTDSADKTDPAVTRRIALAAWRTLLLLDCVDREILHDPSLTNPTPGKK